jgi:hypothetical protein
MTTSNQRLENTAKTDTSAARQASQHEPNAADAEEQIRVRAYELSVDRKGQPGDEMLDWLTAEREYYGSAPVDTR